MTTRIRVHALLWCLIVAGTTVVRAEAVPFDEKRWEISAREHRFETHLGQPALFLSNGAAALVDKSFTNGAIEFDIAFTGERGFVGAMWRLQKAGDFEEFYIRPHQSGNPDANQYTPLFHGSSGWQLYHGDGYGAPVSYKNNEWTHVKIVFSGDRGEVYIGDMQTPAVAIPEMKRDVAAGRVGVVAGGQFAPAWFANFEYHEEPAPVLKASFGKPAPPEPGTVSAWMVSSTFDEKTVAEALTLEESHRKGLTWTRLPVESSGTVNLARVAELTEGRDTVFARVTLVSERETLKKLRFGYSDRVRVYLDGRLLYEGTNDYRSRDYRYLGTIGWFDTVALPLREGANELWFAVSESFGGWGVRARFDDPSGVEVRVE